MLQKLLIVPFRSNSDVNINHQNHTKRLVSLGICFTLLSVLVVGLISSTTNIVYAVDMMGGDAPGTSDTITAGPTGDGDGDDSQSDGMPPPGDAPATTDALTTGGGSDNDDDDDGNEDDDSDSDSEPVPNNKAATGSTLTAKKLECPKGQEVPLFSATCDLIQPPGNTQCDETAERVALTPSPDPSSSLPPQEVGSEAEVELEFSAASEGSYASQCTPALHFGNTGNFGNVPVQTNPEQEPLELGEIRIEPENEEACIAATAAAEQCSTVTPTPTPAPSGTESNNNQPNK
jgi:hypothetical protein